MQYIAHHSWPPGCGLSRVPMGVGEVAALVLETDLDVGPHLSRALGGGREGWVALHDGRDGMEEQHRWLGIAQIEPLL